MQGRFMSSHNSVSLELEESRISKNARPKDDLGADSLDQIEIAMSLEEAFKASAPDWEADRFGTVGDAISFVEVQFRRNAAA
jgi:acyl carrier protein